MLMKVTVKYPQDYLELRDTYEQNFNNYIHIFEVQLFNGVAEDISGNRVIH